MTIAAPAFANQRAARALRTRTRKGAAFAAFRTRVSASIGNVRRWPNEDRLHRRRTGRSLFRDFDAASRFRHEIEIFERNAKGVTFGWGVVFSDLTVDNIMKNDPLSAKRITEEFAHWDDIDVHIHGTTVTSGGHGFIGIGRKQLLEILTDRAVELGARIHFEAECDPADPKWRDYDLVIASDGINSRFRDANPEAFGEDVDVRANKFVWLGTPKVFDAFTFAFEETEAGWIWAHAYRFAPDCSTFIVECSEATWRGLGFDTMEQAEAIALCEKIFAKYLDGQPLLSNAAHLRGSAAWLNFRRIKCERWTSGNVILLGDSAHTAHFSVGSGTKLALEDAIKLAEVLNRPGLSLAAALDDYQAERNLEVLKLQNSARNSTEWFETLGRYLHFEPLQFAYSLLTRSQRISHENLRLRDSEWLSEVERWFWEKAGVPGKSAAPMFAPFKMREMRLANRIVVSPMAMYSAEDGLPNDFHFVHYGERAIGGAGLLFTEMTCVSPEGRISPGCTGLWNDEQAAAWKRIVDFVHAQSDAKICMQLGHSGAKGSTRVGWEGNDVPLAEDHWPVMGPSDVAWSPANPAPTPMTRATWTASATSSSPPPSAPRRPASTWSSFTPLTAICSRHSSPRCRTSAPTNMAEASTTACASRSRCSRRCAPPGRATSRCRSVSRRRTGRATTA